MYKKTIPVARYIHQARNFVRLFTPISKLGTIYDDSIQTINNKNNEKAF